MKSAEEILDIHCTTIYNKYTGIEEIEASREAVIIAMEDYTEAKNEKLLHPVVTENNIIKLRRKFDLGFSIMSFLYWAIATVIMILLDTETEILTTAFSWFLGAIAMYIYIIIFILKYNKL